MPRGRKLTYVGQRASFGSFALKRRKITSIVEKLPMTAFGDRYLLHGQDPCCKTCGSLFRVPEQHFKVLDHPHRPEFVTLALAYGIGMTFIHRMRGELRTSSSAVDAHNAA